MRSAACFLLVLMLSAPVRAEDEPETLAHRGFLDAVIAAFEEKDADKLEEYARSDQYDPWLVADGLVMLGALDAALAYARSAPGQDTARLPAYIEGRKTKKHDPAVRAAMMATWGKELSPEEQEKALAQLDEVVGKGDPFERTVVATMRANFLSAVGRSGEGAEALLEAGKRSERLGWYLMAAECFRACGHQARDTLNYDLMLTAWSSMATIQQGRGDRKGAARATMFVGIVHAELGDYDRSLELLVQAQSIFEEIGDDNGLAWVLNNIAEVHMRRGDYGRAQRAAERGVRLARKIDHPHRVGHLLTLLGSLSQSLDQQDRALEIHQEALEIFEKLGDREGIANCLGNIGNVHSKQGRYTASIAHLERALQIFKDMDEKPQLAKALAALGYTHRKAGRLLQARALQVEGLKLAREVGDALSEGYILIDMAETSIDQKALDEADDHLKQAMKVATRLGSKKLLMDANEALARVRLAEGKYERAVYAARRALEHSISMMAGLSQTQMLVARETLAKLHKTALGAAAAWKKDGTMFAALESVRVGALLQALENRGEIHKATVPEGLAEREREAKRDAKIAVMRYQKALLGDDLRQIREEKLAVGRAQSRVQNVVGQIQREVKAAGSVLYPEALSLADAQAQLEVGQTLVVYTLLIDPAIALVVSKDEARIVDLGDLASLEKTARERLDDAARAPGELIMALRKRLIEPLKLDKKTKTLLVTADGILGFVPFGVLVPDLAVANIPSSTAFAILRADEEKRGKKVLALGDPDYRIEGKAAKPGEPVERGGMRLVPLPASRKEVEEIGDVVLLGKQASPGGLRVGLKGQKRWHAVHLACHGRLDASDPMNSALALAFQKDGRNLLRCADVFQMKIHTDLTVLSACESGRGKVYEVEGIVGLTQAFMLAGSPRVIVSLWKVDDEATQALMIKFYELWNPKSGKPGLGAAEALRQAQAHVREQEKWSHPYYWGAWVLWGLPT